MRVSFGIVHYPVTVLGAGKRVAVWFSGCNRHCKFCETPELQKFSYDAEGSEIIARVLECLRNGADGLTVSGGEPFEQAEFLLELVEAAKNYTDDILVFTGYTLTELKARRDVSTDKVLGLIGVLVDGEYVDGLNDGRGLRGSTNQVIHRLNPKIESLYEGAEKWDRRHQVVMSEKDSFFIGINKSRRKF